MKKLYCIVILFCFVGFGFAEEPQLFLGDDGKPFTGVKKNYPKGEETVYSEYSYTNGIGQGIAKIYWKKTDDIAEKFDITDYFLRTETHFVDGKTDGDFKLYGSNGLLQSVTPYKNGKKEGLALVYYRDGKLMGETMYRDDEMNGVEKAYMRCNGNDYRVEQTRADNRYQGVQRVFVNERLLMEYNIFDDKQNGPAQDHAGEFLSTYQYFVNNKLDGPLISIDRLGKTKIVTHYNNANTVESSYIYKYDKPIMEIIANDNRSAQVFCIAEDNTKRLLSKEKSDFIYTTFFTEQIKSKNEKYDCDGGYNDYFFKNITSPFIWMLEIDSMINTCQ